MMLDIKPEVVALLRNVTPILNDVLQQHLDNALLDTEPLIDYWEPHPTPENPEPTPIDCSAFTVKTLKDFMEAMTLLRIHKK